LGSADLFVRHSILFSAKYLIPSSLEWLFSTLLRSLCKL
jgi:hypothetical protein